MKTLNRQKLREQIEKYGLTPFAFAKKHGFKYESLRQWLNGERTAKISNIQALATALNCSIDDITDCTLDFSQSELVKLKQDKEIICRLFEQMTAQQRKSLIDLAILLPKQNNTQELENGIE